MRLSALIGLVLSLVSVAALAKDASPDSVKGLYLTTDFPAVTIRAGEEADLPLTIYNYGLPPQRTALTVADAPPGWKAEIEGSGKPVGAAFVDYDGKASLTLKLTIPETEKPGDYRLTLNAEGDAAKSSLPIAVTLAPPLAAKLTATPKFPMLSGAARIELRLRRHGEERRRERHDRRAEDRRARRLHGELQGTIRHAGHHQPADQGRREQGHHRLGEAQSERPFGPGAGDLRGDRRQGQRQRPADARHRRPAGDDDQRSRTIA